ncbi:MAG TPA: CDP-glycerol glycerophosphotransferase family protein, partial [Candidatus Limnocylindrales bacterium]|nr:CDP-glycerol glycerophosphotransferase family protein [Candidatus Limnocylindrales bacterium]
VRRRTRGVVRRTTTRAAAWILRTLANEWPYRADFRDAWVLMDRIHDAGDNGERLFEYLVAERPDINAWFVLERDTPDWRRLRAAGVTRLVAHGSFSWMMLMLNARWLLSSHADQPVIRPPSLMQFIGSPTWHYAFLQHGVIKDDLSLWLNPKEIDLFVTSTPEEFDSVAGDGTAYLYTSKETRNTGLPRFDRLLAKARAVAPGERRLVVIAPTWRSWLNLPPESGSQRRDVDDDFWDSDYYASWSALLASPEIHAAAERRGWRIVFMPHPNMSAILSRMPLPRGVHPVSFTDVDAQDVYARTALLVTDYSSVAFNVSYIDRPVVYFQFDHARMMNGEHVGRRGYFDYERDGFGPVATTLQDAVAAIVASIEHGPTPTPAYQERIDATFTNRDGGACSRVVAAIEELSRPVVLARAPLRVAGERDIDGFLTPGQPG